MLYKYAMELFISHAIADIEIAHALRLRLIELSRDLRCFLLADEVFAGDSWEDRIREAANSCDAILCLATADYVHRPWFAAEWAMFWFQEKPWYLVLHDVALENVFQVLHRRQAVRFDDRRSLERLMQSLIEHGGLSSAAATDELAQETVAAIHQAERRARLARAESDLANLAVSLRRGTENVDPEVVARLIGGGRLDAVVELASAVDNWVALRQLAVCLLQVGEFVVAAQLADRIENRAERRTIAVAALDVISHGRADRRAVELVTAIYESVRDPQRRDLLEAGEARDLAIEWPAVSSSP